MSNSEYTWYLVKPNKDYLFDKHPHLVQIYNISKHTGIILNAVVNTSMKIEWKIIDLREQRSAAWYEYIYKYGGLATKISDEEATLYLLKGNLDDLRDD